MARLVKFSRQLPTSAELAVLQNTTLPTGCLSVAPSRPAYTRTTSTTAPGAPAETTRCSGWRWTPAGWPSSRGSSHKAGAPCGRESTHTRGGSGSGARRGFFIISKGCRVLVTLHFLQIWRLVFLRLVWIFRPLGDSVRLIFAQIKSFLTKAVDRKDQRFHSWDSVTSAANNN